MYEQIVEAQERIRHQVRRTPVHPSTLLSAHSGGDVYLKCENLQRTGSFKLRGALNMLSTLPSGSAIVAASAGNHAQAVALAAAWRGLRATVVMPRHAPLAKQRATREYGAEVELVEGLLAAAIERAEEIAAREDRTFVPPFDHPLIVAGQGTLGLEVLEQVPGAETVIVPAGGGGLLAGVAAAVKAVRPAARVVGVQAAAMPGIARSLDEGVAGTVPPVRTLADGVAVAGPSALTFDLIREHVDEVVTVSEEAIAQAIVFLLERGRLVVEGAGALAVAALLSNAVSSPGKAVCVLSGGNIDVNVLGRIAARGLVLSGRHRTLTVAAANVPGEMALVTGGLAAAGANILEVTHSVADADLPIGVSRVTFRLEVSDAEAFERVTATLIERGLQPGTLTDLATPTAASAPR